MSVLSGLLPVEQGVACLAALRKHTDAVVAAGDTRTRDQIMADTLVERVTGQAHAEDVDVEVGIVLPVDALVDPDGAAADVTGHGPIPARIAHDILDNTKGRRWWRRLFATPTGGLVGADPRRRCFDGVLAHLIRVRDGGRCRDRSATPRYGTWTTSTPTARAAPPVWATGAGCASGAITSASCRAGGSSSCTTAAADIRTPYVPPPRPGTPMSVGRARLLGVFPISRGDAAH